MVIILVNIVKIFSPLKIKKLEWYLNEKKVKIDIENVGCEKDSDRKSVKKSAKNKKKLQITKLKLMRMKTKMIDIGL